MYRYALHVRLDLVFRRTLGSSFAPRKGALRCSCSRFSGYQPYTLCGLSHRPMDRQRHKGPPSGLPVPPRVARAFPVHEGGGVFAKAAEGGGLPKSCVPKGPSGPGTVPKGPSGPGTVPAPPSPLPGEVTLLAPSPEEGGQGHPPDADLALVRRRQRQLLNRKQGPPNRPPLLCWRRQPPNQHRRRRARHPPNRQSRSCPQRVPRGRCAQRAKAPTGRRWPIARGS